MSGQLTRFKIEGLHNAHTIDIPIESNKLVLVGENGTGKSTVANFIYFLLTSQWSRMLETRFKSVTAVIDAVEYRYSWQEINELAQLNKTIKRLSHRTSHPLFERVRDIVENIPPEEVGELISQLSSKTGVSVRGLLREGLRFETLDKLNAHKPISSQVLYLPTYRRIEQELERILPDPEVAEFRARRHYLSRRSVRAGYIELVEFGMEDVESTIERKESEIKEKVRQDLSNLTGEYLRDVIQGAYQSIEPSELQELDEDLIDNIFRRIPSEILPDVDKTTLRDIITEIYTTGKIEDQNKVVAHFLTKLVQLDKKQQEDEKGIREFIKVCNEGYLSGKQFTYDNAAFDVSLVQQNINKPATPLSMQSLSSGEKQIVSLFSHLYLSDVKNFFVIIDEPELSLSVPWQKRFLPDILARCDGLIAVTHSPFIFDNELQLYTHALEEFTIPFEYDPELENQPIIFFEPSPYFEMEDEIPF